jgi:hypothetical protein
MNFNRMCKKIAVYWHRLCRYGSFKPNWDENGYEKLSLAIVRKLLNHPESKFTIAPISTKRYIINKKLDIFIIIEDGRVEITNHVYHYVIRLNVRDYEKIVNQFDKYVDNVRLNYENEIKSQISNSLMNIYQNVIKDK